MESKKETCGSTVASPMPIKTENEEFASRVQKIPSENQYEKNFDTRTNLEDTRLSPYHPKKLKIDDQSRPIDMSPKALVKSPTIDVNYPLTSDPSIPPLCPIDNRDKYSRPHYTLNAQNANVSRSFPTMDLSSRTLPSATTYNNAPLSSVLPIAHSASQRVIS